MTDKVKVPEVTDELRQYWKERSERILRNYEAGKYDENNKAMMASVSWARLSMEEKEEGYKKYYFMFDRWQAEADAMKSVQEVYQELIEDMKNDRKELKNAYQEQKKRFDEVDNKYKEVLQKCNEMEKAIKQNARVMDTMKPFLCGVKNCPNRKSITFDTNNN